MRCSLMIEKNIKCRLNAKVFAGLFKWDLSQTKREELMLLVFDVIIKRTSE